MVYPIFCIYNFRHSWATIAQNNCGASTAEVGFALNHSSAHRVTEGYIKKDYSPINLLNEKVIECVFILLHLTSIILNQTIKFSYYPMLGSKLP